MIAPRILAGQRTLVAWVLGLSGVSAPAFHLLHLASDQLLMREAPKATATAPPAKTGSDNAWTDLHSSNETCK